MSYRCTVLIVLTNLSIIEQGSYVSGGWFVTQ